MLVLFLVERERGKERLTRIEIIKFAQHGISRSKLRIFIKHVPPPHFTPHPTHSLYLSLSFGDRTNEVKHGNIKAERIKRRNEKRDRERAEETLWEFTSKWSTDTFPFFRWKNILVHPIFLPFHFTVKPIFVESKQTDQHTQRGKERDGKGKKEVWQIVVREKINSIDFPITFCFMKSNHISPSISENPLLT